MSEPTRPVNDPLEIPVDSPHAVTPTSSRRWWARATCVVLAVLVSGCVINPVPTPATTMGGGALDGQSAGNDTIATAADAVMMDAGANSADTGAAADAATTADAGADDSEATDAEATDAEATDAEAAEDAALPDDATATGDTEVPD